jgi:transposase
MNSEHIFGIALGIKSPWEIVSINFNDKLSPHELHITIDFKRGSKFADQTGSACDVYDTTQKTWRHLNFFQHACFLHCRVPRIKTTAGKVQLIQCPWARAGSGFTLLFEAYAMALIEKEMPINKVGALLGEDPHRVWTIFNYWINRAYQKDEIKGMTKLGLDETSQRKGHRYVTVAVDLDERRVVHVTEGKDKAAVKAVKDYIEGKGVNAKAIEHASMDMSPSFISGVMEDFSSAEIHFDRFHVVKLLNEAMNKVRQLERKEHAELKGHKYTFLKKQDNLSCAKKDELNQLIELFPRLGEAYRLKELFNDLWDMGSEEEATEFLVMWCQEVENKKIAPFQSFVNTVKSHWTGIVNFCETEINNGILEGINSKIQLAKKRARGYRKTENFINMIYFLCGKLKFDYPLYSS